MRANIQIGVGELDNPRGGNAGEQVALPFREPRPFTRIGLVQCRTLFLIDPDALAAEFSSRNVEFSKPLTDTHEGLRGFEFEDADGYVLFFARPRS